MVYVGAASVEGGYAVKTGRFWEVFWLPGCCGNDAGGAELFGTRLREGPRNECG